MGEDENTPRFPWQQTWEAPKPLEEELNQYSTPEEREMRALEGARKLAATSLRSTSKPAASRAATSRAAVPISIALPAVSYTLPTWSELLSTIGSALSVPATAAAGSLLVSGDTSPEEQEYIRLLARERVARDRALGREHASEIPVWMTTLDAEKAALPKRTSITVPFRPVEGYVEQPPYMANVKGRRNPETGAIEVLNKKGEWVRVDDADTGEQMQINPDKDPNKDDKEPNKWKKWRDLIIGGTLFGLTDLGLVYACGPEDEAALKVDSLATKVDSLTTLTGQLLDIINSRDVTNSSVGSYEEAPQGNSHQDKSGTSSSTTRRQPAAVDTAAILRERLSYPEILLDF